MQKVRKPDKPRHVIRSQGFGCPDGVTVVICLISLCVAIQCVVIHHYKTQWTRVKGEGVDSLSEEAKLFATFKSICNVCVLMCEVYEAVIHHMK